MNSQFMKFQLTIHARQVVEERAIQQKWIERVLHHPKCVEADKGDPCLNIDWEKSLNM